MLLAILDGRRAEAQEAVDTAPPGASRGDRGWLSSLVVAVPGTQGDLISEALLIMGRFTSVRDNALGVDVAAGLMPRSLQFGAAVIAGQAGVAASFPVSQSAVLIPSAGVGGLAAVGAAAAGTFGPYAGLAVASRGSGRTGVRLGLSAQRFGAFPGATIWLLEFGISSDGRVQSSRYPE